MSPGTPRLASVLKWVLVSALALAILLSAAWIWVREDLRHTFYVDRPRKDFAYYARAYYGHYGKWPGSVAELLEALKPAQSKWVADWIRDRGVTIAIISKPTDDVFRAQAEMTDPPKRFVIQTDCSDIVHCRSAAQSNIRGTAEAGE